MKKLLIILTIPLILSGCGDNNLLGIKDPVDFEGGVLIHNDSYVGRTRVKDTTIKDYFKDNSLSLQMGLLPNDVIYRINEVNVTSVHKLHMVLNNLNFGDTLKIDIKRYVEADWEHDYSRTIKLTLESTFKPQVDCNCENL